MKVGKEEAVAMLMAVEMWMKRDHKAESARWLSWLDTIAKQVSTVDGVTTSVTETTELSNRTPTLVIQWDPKRRGITGAAVARLLLEGEPRIATPGGRDRDGQSSISITPYMMAAGEEKVVAERLHAGCVAFQKRDLKDDALDERQVGSTADRLSKRVFSVVQTVQADITPYLRHIGWNQVGVDRPHVKGFLDHELVLAGASGGEATQQAVPHRVARVGLHP